MKKASEEFNYDYCKTAFGRCAYLSRTPSCDYHLKTKRRRPCPAGEGCTEHTGLKKKEATMEETNKKRKYSFDTEKAMELYKQGLSDIAIGKACYVSAQTIYKWRRKNNLEANRGVKPKEEDNAVITAEPVEENLPTPEENVTAPTTPSAEPVQEYPIEPLPEPTLSKTLSLGDFARTISKLLENYGDAEFEIVAASTKYSTISASLRLTADCTIEKYIINLN